MGLRRRFLVLALVASAVGAAGCGGDDVDADQERLREADTALAKNPGDPRAQVRVIDVALTAARRESDPVAGTHTGEGLDFLKRAAEVWPRYVVATRRRPDPRIAGQMALVLGDALSRPKEGAQAMLFVTAAQPSSAAYLRLAELYARAGDTRGRDLAGQKALELADAGERTQVREAIRYFRTLPAP